MKTYRACLLSFFLSLIASPAAALQVGDGQYNNTYNDLDLAATQARFNNITTKGAGGGVPVGTIIAWPVATNPEDMENWLECNGQAVNAAMYPELRNVIGPNVPDLRGLFLRGQGGQSAALGIQQGDAIQNIVGDVGFTSQHNLHTGPFRSIRNGCCYSGSPENISFHLVNFDASRVVPTAEENRPVNMAVRYLIRAQ